MKSFSTITISIASLFLISCSTIAPPAPHGSVDHVVVIWLKNPGNPTDRQAILTASDNLRRIPGLLTLDSGFPLPSDRPVVDDSFDIAFTMRFDSVNSLNAYECDPRHLKEVAEVLKPLSQKILVYDITR